MAWVLANIHRNQAQRPEPFELSDFMLGEPGEVEVAEELTPEEQIVWKLKALVFHMGGTDETAGVRIDPPR